MSIPPSTSSCQWRNTHKVSRGTEGTNGVSLLIIIIIIVKLLWRLNKFKLRGATNKIIWLVIHRDSQKYKDICSVNPRRATLYFISCLDIWGVERLAQTTEHQEQTAFGVASETNNRKRPELKSASNTYLCKRGGSLRTSRTCWRCRRSPCRRTPRTSRCPW